MKLTMSTATSAFVVLLAFCLVGISQLLLCSGHVPPNCDPNLIVASDRDTFQFALNLEFLEAEMFLNAAFGKGLDFFSPNLTLGGPPPIGAQKANLDPIVHYFIGEFGYQEIAHIRSIFRKGGFPRPLLNLSRQNFAELMNRAVGFTLIPPFHPYENSLNFLLAIYTIPYVGLNGYVAMIPYLQNMTSRRLAAGLLGVEGEQDTVVRTFLYQRASERVHPYNLTVADFTNSISMLSNDLGMCGIKDEGIIVPEELGAENRTCSNIISANPNSLSYARTPPEILRIVYATGNESLPGGFYPKGANGKIARRFLKFN